MKPFISFPGTYRKDREIREILGVLWRYLTHKLSCVITIGLGGWWDPILVAFLCDLVRERDLLFVDVNATPEDSYIVKEIVTPEDSQERLAIKLKADEFMEILGKSIEQSVASVTQVPATAIGYTKNIDNDDGFWAKLLEDWEMSDFERELVAHDFVRITGGFAQLGLKSRWLGISGETRWQHNRLNHSKGVMKVATFLYEKACENSGRPEKPAEKQFLRIAALLHDIGHMPFSHLIEEVFQELNWRPGGYTESFSHEYYTGQKIRGIFEARNLKTQLERIGYNVD
jgi:hypothetical protein